MSVKELRLKGGVEKRINGIVLDLAMRGYGWWQRIT